MICFVKRHVLKWSNYGKELEPITPWLEEKLSRFVAEIRMQLTVKKSSQQMRALTFTQSYGDCYRLVEHMRKFNPYDPSMNKKGPINDVGPKGADGRPSVSTFTERTELDISTDSLKKKQSALKKKQQNKEKELSPKEDIDQKYKEWLSDEMKKDASFTQTALETSSEDTLRAFEANVGEKDTFYNEAGSTDINSNIGSIA